MQTIYPTANRSAWHQDNHPGASITPSRIILHTTEGGTLDDYAGGSNAPHFTVDNGRGVVYQHFPINVNSRALMNAPGGVQTNMQGAIQIEIMGTCDPNNPNGVKPFLPGLSADKFTPLIDLLVWLSKQTGIPLVGTPRAWISYPDSYGNSAARMTFDEWNNFNGVAGHQHVPENFHGDPGGIPINAILTSARAKAGSKVITAAIQNDSHLSSKFAGDLNRELCWGAFPLPAGDWYGVNDGTSHSHSGAQAADKRAVRQVQRTVGVADDSVIGPQSQAAIKRWQTAHGLKADGMFGQASWTKAAAL